MARKKPPPKNKPLVRLPTGTTKSSNSSVKVATPDASSAVKSKVTNSPLAGSAAQTMSPPPAQNSSNRDLAKQTENPNPETLATDTQSVPENKDQLGAASKSIPKDPPPAASLPPAVIPPPSPIVPVSPRNGTVTVEYDLSKGSLSVDLSTESHLKEQSSSGSSSDTTLSSEADDPDDEDQFIEPTPATMAKKKPPKNKPPVRLPTGTTKSSNSSVKVATSDASSAVKSKVTDSSLAGSAAQRMSPPPAQNFSNRDLAKQTENPNPETLATDTQYVPGNKDQRGAASNSVPKDPPPAASLPPAVIPPPSPIVPVSPRNGTVTVEYDLMLSSSLPGMLFLLMARNSFVSQRNLRS
ncbi:hypothetical protein DY000_02004725 [Brassica cretica]|uniref:Uncharacterized protein n=1 Tax=Brassica cretica TaxID=69181 RepID=A0ABQ7C4S5_BRACR|nr:hypothetical protein DY000_02004725 [Brassica cretica]